MKQSRRLLIHPDYLKRLPPLASPEKLSHLSFTHWQNILHLRLLFFHSLPAGGKHKRQFSIYRSVENGYMIIPDHFHKRENSIIPGHTNPSYH
jgi:hypothetical protein